PTEVRSTARARVAGLAAPMARRPPVTMATRCAGGVSTLMVMGGLSGAKMMGWLLPIRRCRVLCLLEYVTGVDRDGDPGEIAGLVRAEEHAAHDASLSGAKTGLTSM